MEPEFWHARWRDNLIGFHQPDINRHLQQFWPQLGAPPGAGVFVPLCGKSLDMLWLASQGHPVLGVEISDIAVRAFFEENKLQPDIEPGERFSIWRCGEITLLLGDFFDLTADDVAACGAIYDRASLIALPPDMRQSYANHLAGLFGPGTLSLLITLDYPQEQMNGPPFAVPEPEVRALFEPTFEVKALRSVEVLDDEPRFREQGLTRLTERVYRMQRKAR